LDRKKIKILIIDDEKDIRDSLKDILIDEGYEILLASNATEAKKIKASGKIDLILLDIWMPDIDGLSLLREWSALNEIVCPVIMMSGHGTIDTAIEATKIGATDFLEKPISLQKLLKTISSSLKNSSDIKKIDKTFFDECNLPYIIDIKSEIEKMKNSDLSVIVGKKSDLMDIFISFLFNTNFYHVKKPSDINDNLLNLIQMSGLRFLLIENCIGSLSKYEDYEKIFYDLVASKIKILFIEKEKDTTDTFFKNEKNIFIYEPSSLSNYRDIIPDLSNALLTYHLNKNPNLSFKFFDSSALNSLRNHFDISSIDQLDSIIISLIQNSTNELLNKEDIENILNLHKSNVDKNQNNNTNIDHLYEKPLKESRDIFETMYLKYHLSNIKSITELSKKTGIERTHLYRKLKQLGIKV